MNPHAPVFVPSPAVVPPTSLESEESVNRRRNRSKPLRNNHQRDDQQPQQQQNIKISEAQRKGRRRNASVCCINSIKKNNDNTGCEMLNRSNVFSPFEFHFASEWIRQESELTALQGGKVPVHLLGFKYTSGHQQQATSSPQRRTPKRPAVRFSKERFLQAKYVEGPNLRRRAT